MADIKEYLKYYKDKTFKEYSFNEVDNVLFSELSYLDWTNIVTNKITLQNAANILLENKDEKKKKRERFKYVDNIKEHLKEMKDSLRYKDCILKNFRLILTEKEQFGAICIYFEPGKLYVSFQGTDESVIGWKEDFEMSYSFPVPSQTEAINYLNENVTWRDNIVFVGGHSKGGNLAICSVMYCKDYIRHKIKFIFNNDGPGFREKEFSSKEYNEISDRIISFKPEDSIVGVLLNNLPATKVVKSKEKGIRAHDITSWECFGTFLEEGILSENSKKIESKFKNWLSKYKDEEKKKLVLTFFEILEKIGVKSIYDFKKIDLSKVRVAVGEMKNIDADTKRLYLEALRNLLIN